MKTAHFSEAVRRHGLFDALIAAALRALHRVVYFDILRVETAEGEPTASPQVDGYETRLIDREAYAADAPSLGPEHAREWAFDRGDLCFASYRNGELVGYTFYASEATTVKDGLDFRFPDDLMYTYAGYTHPDHRGRGLAPARGNLRRTLDLERGIHRQIVWYISVHNLPARAASKRFGVTFVGHLAYINLFGRFRCWASRGCRRAGVYLEPVPE